jgi:hypothetical protein
MAPDSRHLNPAAYFAAITHPPNFPVKARAIIAIVYPHVTPVMMNFVRSHVAHQMVSYAPLFRRPRSVERPESVKYYSGVMTNQNAKPADLLGVKR